MLKVIQTEKKRPNTPPIKAATNCIVIEILHSDLTTSETTILLNKNQHRGDLIDGTSLMEHVNVATKNIALLDSSAIGYRATGYYLNDKKEWQTFFNWDAQHITRNSN